MGDKTTISTAVSNPQTKAKIKAAVNQRIANADIKTYADIDKLAASSIQIFGTEVTNDSQKKAAYTEYSRQLLLEYYDLDKDGKVTVEEFGKKEASGALTAGELTAQQLGYQAGKTEKTIANRCGNLFAQNLDLNGNGNIDAEELAFFNENADIIDGKADGKITNAGESAMFREVTGMNASNQEYNRVVNKYLMGETLTPAEQQTLKECQATIRKNMGKAAGLNIEG